MIDIFEASSRQEAAIDLFCLTDDVIERLKKEKDFQINDHKKLWFLIDAENPEGWIKKACITASYHKMDIESMKVLDLFVKIKDQMAEDRKNGLHLW